MKKFECFLCRGPRRYHTREDELRCSRLKRAWGSFDLQVLSGDQHIESPPPSSLPPSQMPVVQIFR
jgi:hypothetical protein